jgi:hypothetical protein
MMDQAWQSSIDEFQCAKCGAIYDVAITHLAARADYDAICNVCQNVMNEWHAEIAVRQSVVTLDLEKLTG